ncbi:MAG: N-acetylglucosamine-6-phosphate deacetylase [Alphaproteobacteria bacterium]|nr:N-acetylglucosamine-6-phosphate deacetylase [Alphaproteobacteria bacterium]
MMLALVNGRVLFNHGIVDGQAVLLGEGHIRAVVPAAALPSEAARYDLNGGFLLPGFIDVQVNGGGGALFNDAPTVETIRTIGAAHKNFGTTGFLPTIISADLAAIKTAIIAVDAAIQAGVPGVLGIHIEGPFLSSARKGIHDASKFRTLDTEAFELLTSLKRGKTLLTLAPETTTPETIRALADAGVIVSAGHTDSSFDVVQGALHSGVRGFTHLFNAMSPLTSREPGAVGAALDDRESWCGIIVDGHHVHPAVLRIALHCKGAERLMLITDAMPSVGSPTNSFALQGRTITVKDGVCIAPDGTLAGSDLDMATAVRNTISLLGVDLPTAARMASSNPAAFLGLDQKIGRIAPGYSADLVLLNDKLEVQQCWVSGRPRLAS